MTILERDGFEPVEPHDGCQCGYPDEPGFCPGPQACVRVIEDVRAELNGCVRALEARETEREEDDDA